MAKYDQPRVAQLYLSEFPKHVDIRKYRYRVTVTSQDKKRSLVSDENTFIPHSQKTRPIEVYDDTDKVQIDIYLNKIWMGGYILRHYQKNAKIAYDQAKIKSTTASNSEQKNHIKEVKIPQNAEVGWKLIKKEQTFDELLREVYKKVPNHSELDIFRHANAHISDLQDLNLNKKIKPGQIILITNKKNSPELTEHKKLALEAEKIFQYLSTQNGFDPNFYANNFELLMDYLALAQQVQIARVEYLKTVEGHKESYCGDITFNKKVESANAAAIYSDQTKQKLDDQKIQRLNQELLGKLNNDIAVLQRAYNTEVQGKTKLSNPKHDADFRRKNYHLYQRIEQTIAANFIQLQDNKEFAKTLKNVVRDTSGVKAPDFMGGLKLNVKMMETIGRATISLKLGMKLVLYFYIAESATKVYGASQTGDTAYTVKVATVETANIGGSILLGSLGAAAGAELGAMAGAKIGLILSPVTGGASIAIGGIVGAGIGAVALGVGGGFAGSYGGTQVARKYTGVCD
ncbi:hypothetical protein [Acinetobacter indicus]|uniref:Uncharacterized protein n=1 Tax=Acinetobacter indicus TaxID=756892 RepID=A0A6C0Y4E8_9GAMM|nr:hypothetical protein [Acinetobacter indicus]QIC71127.1 hypothetical protein FSC09_12295 [Acinetobacter indicus]QSG86044.1 hypothetical protein JYB86_03060 [Acinetobacter indicus]